LIGVEQEYIHNNEQLDQDWAILVKRAIDKGRSKEEFKELSGFIRFKNSQQINNCKSSGSNEELLK
jgi:hypothetical protein